MENIPEILLRRQTQRQPHSFQFHRNDLFNVQKGEEKNTKSVANDTYLTSNFHLSSVFFFYFFNIFFIFQCIFFNFLLFDFQRWMKLIFNLIFLRKKSWWMKNKYVYCIYIIYGPIDTKQLKVMPKINNKFFALHPLETTKNCQ